MSQMPVPPRFHRSDPLTSGQAALDHRVSGKLGRDQELALRLVREHPGSTAKELGERLKEHYESEHNLSPANDVYRLGREVFRQRVGRRLSELLAHSLVYREGVRDGCALWWPVQTETVAQGRLFDVTARRVWD